MKSKTAISLDTLMVLQALFATLSGGIHPQKWWQEQISILPSEARRIILGQLATLLSTEMQGVSHFAQKLNLDKTRFPEEFNSVLFDFLVPLYHLLIQRSAWDEVLNLESVIYTFFIKQDEDHKFYAKAFAELYSPYDCVSKANKNLDSNLLSSHQVMAEPIIFWFQNYSVLAHTNLVLDLAANLTSSANFYASALSNINLEQSSRIFEEVGIKIIPIDDKKSMKVRCQELISICNKRRIKNIVFVSLPLQSGYIKTICKDIQLTWWSLKYPLGCMHHFDRLVCNRTLFPTQKKFHGTVWQCAPFSVKALNPHPKPVPLGLNPTDLKMGVLSREEKFASSQLPEILNLCLKQSQSLHLYWTGRQENSSLMRRLQGYSGSMVRQQIHFCGWVDPALFLTQIDLLIDTPNLGGMVAYWMMSMGKVVISASESGSVGALGSPEDLDTYFTLLASPEDIDSYFEVKSTRPYYLSNAELIPLCVARYKNQKDLLQEHGQRFLRFFSDNLSDMSRWSETTFLMLQGINQSNLESLNNKFKIYKM